MGVDGKPAPELEAMIKVIGSFILVLGFALFTVRWNTINGKLTGLGCILAAANIVHVFYKALDNEVFVLRPPYVLAGLLALTGLKLMFFANPLVKKVEDDKKKQ